ncbi:hypothetical protein KPH14_007660 [Odynerus spinipes]|uniref:Uncharacterized protein n=1 Tax=Odynerus spinipes TaxID=1348599 RepID=A0AAD9R9F7_9HYME|nr:hypothetical protein KPH14_007660 [Odynerus spinipes]
MSNENSLNFVRVTRSNKNSLKSPDATDIVLRKTRSQSVTQNTSIKVNKTSKTKRISNTRRKEESTQSMSQGRNDEASEIENEWQRLRSEKERLERERQEIEKIRNEIMATQRPANTENQDDRTERTRSRNDQPEEQLVNGLVNHLKNLHVNINIPKFIEENNPVEYIEDTERYFKLKNVSSEQQLVVIENIIEGRVKVWYNAIRDRIATFAEFRQAFLEEFYSIPIKVRFKNQWATRRYRPSDGSMHSYFYKQLKETRSLIRH